MTNWLPDISSGNGPVYIRVADSIENAITHGVLPPGTKLPPQRNLAYDIGVTIGTVSRAYALVHERGLVAGEVGRGTYVLERSNGKQIEQVDPITQALAGPGYRPGRDHRQTVRGYQPRTPIGDFLLFAELPEELV